MGSSAAPLLQLASAVFLVLVSSSAATDHIVGANKGWNPGLNYTLWANNHTFYVGDLISFRYQKTQYNVFEVNQTGYDNCTTEGATGNWSSGKDFILLDKPKRYYFICGNGGCFSGMKVSVLVHALPPPPNSSTPDHTSAAAPPPIGVLGVILGALVSACFGLG
ncbi:lamin-like protein [Salvia hispanica]|uniref:lamin-like protein n=1 Tax=Salvia hispanica TaxID=49212 RepID=UPI002009D20E|nr:lamin-like protein [Salvia hispanica]